MPSPDVSSLIPVPIIGYVQSQSNTVHAMTQWLPDARWEPVPGGLANQPNFLLYMSLAENTAGSWSKLPVFCELGLNNAGRRAARENGRVLCRPFHPLPRPADCMNSRESSTPSSSNSSEKTSSVREWPACLIVNQWRRAKFRCQRQCARAVMVGRCCAVLLDSQAMWSFQVRLAIYSKKFSSVPIFRLDCLFNWPC